MGFGTVHDQQRDFIRRAIGQYRRKIKTVIDCGSLDINGSNRTFFPHAGRYTGIDLGPGPGVDHVGPCHEYDGMAQCVISGEMLEHDRHWTLSIPAMRRMTAPRGILIVTCATHGRPEHGTAENNPHDSPYTRDWYRPIGWDELLLHLEPDAFSRWALELDHGHHDLYFWGVMRNTD